MPGPLTHPTPLGVTTPSTGGSFPTPIRHVFIVMLENSAAYNSLAQGPYERYLANKYAYADHYYAVCHPSAPNYLALTSGNAWQCGTDAYNVYNVTNVGTLLNQANRSWSEFAQSMPYPCDTTNTGAYFVKHDPFVYYRDIVTNPSMCDAHVQNFTAWSNDVADATIPNFGFITPNITSDGHDTSVAFADAWLKSWLSPLVNDSFFKTSVFFITDDESAFNDTSGYNGTAGGNVYLAAVSPYARNGSLFSPNSSHYNLLATTEWLLGLSNCGQNDSNPGFPAMKGLFKFPPPSYPVSGTVSSSMGGTPIAGANVSVEGQQKSNLTDGAGGYTLHLPTGIYTLNATAPGYLSGSHSVNVSGSGVVQNFSLTVRPATLYTLSGGVYAFTTGLPISGANVSVTPGTTEVTGGGGLYSFSLANGSYDVSTSAPDFNSTTYPAMIAGAAVDHNFWLNVSSSGPPPNLKAVASVASDPIVAGTSVAFSVTVSGGTPPYTEFWTFDDGGSSTAATPQHSFVSSGNYTVTVRVNDSKGDETNGSVPVEVVPVVCACPSEGTHPAVLPPWLPWLLAVAALAVVLASVMYIRHRRSSPSKGTPQKKDP